MKRNKQFFFVLLCLFLAKFSMAQEITVRGNVQSGNDGSSLPGVNVSVKNTTLGTVTDLSGNYVLSNIPENSVILFSFLGFEDAEVPVNGEMVINVKLYESNEALEEVVVIGYGETTRKKFTGALTSLTSDQLQSAPHSSAVQSLQGKSAGVLITDSDGQPGSVGEMVIRGVGSISGSSSPLYIIDGTPTNTLANFNPGDIESISILKDAAATSIYGSRAANGVVIITTKQGAKGETKVSLNAQYGISDLENPNNFGVMNSEEYVDYYRAAILNAGFDPDDPSSGYYMPVNLSEQNTDWVDEVTQTGVTQNYELSIQGGNSGSKHYVSLGYLDQKGIVKNTGFERYSGRVNYSFKITDKLNAKINALGAYAESQNRFRGGGGRSGQFSGAHNVAPTSAIYADENTVLSGAGYNFDLPSNANHNPVAAANINDEENKQVRIFPTLKIDFKPIENLTLSSQAALDWTYSEYTAYQSKYYLAETDNGLSTLDQSTDLDFNVYATAKYNVDFNENHKASVLVGAESYQESERFTTAGSKNFAFEGINNFAAGGETSTGFMDYDYSKVNLVSFFNRMDYSYKEKLFINTSLRRDGSSKFGSKNTWGTFYAVGAGYALSEEPFMKDQNIFQSLRLRGSYGIMGNDKAADTYDWRPLYNAGGTYVVPLEGGAGKGSNSGSRPSSPGNNFLKWEEIATLNFAVDFSVLKNRISGTVEWYNRNSIDLITQKYISHTSGFTYYDDNIGKVRNTGVEIALHSDNVKSKNFQWSTDFNITFNNNEIKKLNALSDSIIGTQQANIVGRSLNEWYLPQYAGVDPLNGQNTYYTEDGGLTYEIGNAVKRSSGHSSVSPDYYGSFTNTFKYKGVSFSAMFYFKYGTKIYRNMLRSMSVTGGNNLPDELANYWKQPGDRVPNAKPNVLVNDLNHSTKYLEDGSFIRLRELALTYSLPNMFTEKMGLSNVILGVKGTNLLTFTNYGGYNVETGSYESSRTYPAGRTVTFNISANF